MPSNFAELHSDAELLGAASAFVSEFIEAVQNQPEFNIFSEQETALLSEYLECFGVPRDSFVVSEGDEGDFLAILVTGKAVILKLHEGKQKLVHELGTGEMIGEMSLIDGQPRFASCMTTEPSDFALMTNENLHALLADHPRLGNKFLMMLLNMSTQRLRNATSRVLPALSNVNVAV
jgi:CRP-like cAMP-binding protein